MSLDAGTIAKGFQESSGYYLAALLVLAISFVFGLYVQAIQSERNRLRDELTEYRAYKNTLIERMLTAIQHFLAVVKTMDVRHSGARPKKGKTGNGKS